MEYVFFAGTNGSGKSTLIKSLRRLDEYRDFRFICADEIESKPALAGFDRHERMKAANFLARELREASLRAGENLIYESVASHPSHLDDLDRIKAMGYTITAVYVSPESPEINLARIAKRGRDNDTYLTEERVTGRYKRSLALLSEIIRRADTALVYDNSINYYAVFYKTPEGRHYLIGERKWAQRYIADKLRQEGIRVFTADDLDHKTYMRLLTRANRLVEPEPR